MNEHLQQEPLIPEVVQKNPMALAAPGEVQNLVALADALVIDCPEMFALAGQELRTIVAKRKAVEEIRMSITRPMDQAKQAVMDFFNRVLGPLNASENDTRAKMGAWEKAERDRVELERRAAEDAARAERQAAEKAQREAEALAQAERDRVQAALAGDESVDLEAAMDAAAEAEHVAAEARDRAEAVEVAPLVPVSAVQKVAGVGFRSTWAGEFTSLDELIEHCATEDGKAHRYLLTGDQVALNGVARATKGAIKIPGVRFIENRTASVRK